MRYREIVESMDGNATGSLADIMLDLLTPLAGQGIEYITVDQLIGKLKHIPTGQLVDRELVMAVLDPDKFPLVKSIEGDKIYLTQRHGPERSVSDKQKETEEEKIKKTAGQQAIKNIKN